MAKGAFKIYTQHTKSTESFLVTLQPAHDFNFCFEKQRSGHHCARVFNRNRQISESYQGYGFFFFIFFKEPTKEHRMKNANSLDPCLSQGLPWAAMCARGRRAGCSCESALEESGRCCHCSVRVFCCVREPSESCLGGPCTELQALKNKLDLRGKRESGSLIKVRVSGLQLKTVGHFNLALLHWKRSCQAAQVTPKLWSGKTDGFRQLQFPLSRLGAGQTCKPFWQKPFLKKKR